jgi:hypothetical protein
MGQKSTFTAAQKRDAVMDVISKRDTVSQTRREPGISGPWTPRGKTTSTSKAVRGVPSPSSYGVDIPR